MVVHFDRLKPYLGPRVPQGTAVPDDTQAGTDGDVNHTLSSPQPVILPTSRVRETWNCDGRESQSFNPRSEPSPPQGTRERECLPAEAEPEAEPEAEAEVEAETEPPPLRRSTRQKRPQDFGPFVTSFTIQCKDTSFNGEGGSVT